MIEQHIIDLIGTGYTRGLVFSAGGSGDLILAKVIATRLIRSGFSRVDLAQPLHCRALSELELHSEEGVFYALEPEAGLDPDCVLRHNDTLPLSRIPERDRGTGLSISALLEWNHGARYVCATYGGGPHALASRLDRDAPYYEFGVGVDGGGDSLTHGDDEADRAVLAGYNSGWPSSSPLLFIAMGLGGDGGSHPADFEHASLPGWVFCGSQVLDHDFASSVREELSQLSLWNNMPSAWTNDHPIWGYGFKVGQILSMAIENDFPFDVHNSPSDLVRFPRRRELKLMKKHLLREARFFLHEVAP